MTMSLFLDGKKTHIIGWIMAAYGVLGVVVHFLTDGKSGLPPAEAWLYIGNGLGLSALRAGVSKIANGTASSSALTE